MNTETAVVAVPTAREMSSRLRTHAARIRRMVSHSRALRRASASATNVDADVTAGRFRLSSPAPSESAAPSPSATSSSPPSCKCHTRNEAADREAMPPPPPPSAAMRARRKAMSDTRTIAAEPEPPPPVIDLKAVVQQVLTDVAMSSHPSSPSSTASSDSDDGDQHTAAEMPDLSFDDITTVLDDEEQAQLDRLETVATEWSASVINRVTAAVPKPTASTPDAVAVHAVIVTLAPEMLRMVQRLALQNHTFTQLLERQAILMNTARIAPKAIRPCMLHIVRRSILQIRRIAVYTRMVFVDEGYRALVSADPLVYARPDALKLILDAYQGLTRFARVFASRARPTHVARVLWHALSIQATFAERLLSPGEAVDAINRCKRLSDGIEVFDI